MAVQEVRIVGLGGQGVIMAGMIIGKAKAIFEDRFATLIQSFGPEARGSACSAQVILADQPIAYPYVTKTSILVAMSQEGYDKFIGELLPGGLVVYEADMVHPDARMPAGARSFGIPAIKMADEMGRRIILNLIMVGFVTAVTGLVDRDAVHKSVADSVPPGTEPFNLKAFDMGFDYGMKLLHNEKKGS